MKFIHFTDLHLAPRGECLHGAGSMVCAWNR